MTLGPQNADDSCLVNQTVPAGDTQVQPVQPEKKSEAGDGGDKEAWPAPASIRNSVNGDDSGAAADPEAEAEDDADFPEGGLAAWLVVLGSFCAMITTVYRYYDIYKEDMMEGYKYKVHGTRTPSVVWIIHYSLITVQCI